MSLAAIPSDLTSDPASRAKPTVLVVHGSWHFPEHYRKFTEALEAAGFPTSCPCEPTYDALPPVGLIEDAQCMREELHRLVNVEHKEVIVVGHSYGGVVTTQAVDAEFGVARLKAKGLEGGVVGILYLCAFVLLEGESLSSALGGGPAPHTKIPPFIPVDDKGQCTMEDPERRFYHDLPPEEQAHWASLLRPVPAITQTTPITHAAYLHHPVTFLVCEDDQALPAFLQRKMVEDVEKGAGVKFTMESCPLGHSPFLSQPEAIVKVIKKMVGE